MKSWSEMPVRNALARSVALAAEVALDGNVPQFAIPKILNAIEMVVIRALESQDGRGKFDPATGVPSHSEIQYQHRARTAEEAIRDAALVAHGRNIPSPRPGIERSGVDEVGTADPAAAVQQPKKRPSWA